MNHLSKRWKLSLWILIFFLISFGKSLFAQENSDINSVCSLAPELIGPQGGLIDQELHYEIKLPQALEEEKAKVRFFLDGNRISETWLNYSTHFEHTGHFELLAKIQQDDCERSLNTSIAIYEKNLLYLWTEPEFLHFWFEEELNKAGYLFSKIFTSSNEETANESEHIAFNSAHTIIINDKNFQNYLEKYITLKRSNQSAPAKNLIIATSANPILLRRSFAQYAQDLENDTITIISPSNLINLISDLSLEKDFAAQEYSTQFSWDFKNSPKRMLISYFVDELLKTGFPIQILGLLLSLSVVALVISFSRQIVGLGVFGVYQPLLLALCASIAGLKVTLFIFGIALLASLVIKSISHRFYLLHSSKVSLLITFFLLFFLAGSRISSTFEFWFLERKGLFTIWLLFPLILGVLIADKTFPHFKIWTKGRWISCWELLIVSGIAYGILQRDWINNLLLSYPELLFLIIIINFIIGRFSGLQILEFLRFMPLIRKHLDEEEE